MTHKDGGKGSLILDRVTPVGRIKRASGTVDPSVMRKLNTMVTSLADAARVDYLRALRDCRMRPLEVYEIYRVHGAGKMPAMDAVKGLKAALDAWVITAECGERHRAAHRTMVKRVTANAAPDAPVSELPALLESVRAKYKARRKHAAFNRIRASALSFARDTLRRSHPVYGAIVEVPVLKERKLRVNNPQTPAQVRELVAKLTADYDRAAVWGMALTGMGPGEWFGKWAVKPDRIHIQGTKREARIRDVPRVHTELFCVGDVPVKPPRFKTVEWPIRQFSDAMKTASGGVVQPYDLRRTYATWGELAGVPRTRRRQYLGHSAGDVTAIYEYQDVARYLAEDAERLTAWLDAQLTQQADEEPQQEPVS